jgi:hypothetical protein
MRREGEECGAGRTETPPPVRPDRAALIAKARQVAARLGKTQLCRSDFVRATGLNETQVRRWFRGWRDFFAAAGLEASLNNMPVADARLLAALGEKFRKERKIANPGWTGKVGPFAMARYRRRWGTWHNILAAFQDWIAAKDPTYPLLDQLARATGRAPRPARALAQWPAIVGRRLGEPLSVKGLQHAPTNEQGVVLLFGMMAEALGYVVESVGGEYPDCEAKRRVATAPERWQRVRIEFEWRSRNFRVHRHDPKGCDLIVCWEHDWPECPVEVVELRREVGRMKG